MSAMDRMNDRWGNIEKTTSRFMETHSGERIIYRSAGALFKRRGDTPLKGWTVFLNKRGNLIISDKRTYFSNPSFSGRVMIFLMIPLYLILVATIMGSASLLALVVFKSVIAVAVYNLALLPLLFLMILAVGINAYQRIPAEIDLDHLMMKRRYLGTYKAITRPCPMFSCYDGKHS